MTAFHLEWDAAVLARGARVEKRVHLSLEHALLDGFEELLRLRERQAQVLDALGVLLQGDDIGDGFFLIIIAAHDELEFHTHGGAPPGLSRGGMMQAILPEFVASPQHLHALLADGIPISHIATTVGISRRFVYKWAKRFVQDGLEGLADKPGRGGKSGPRQKAMS